MRKYSAVIFLIIACLWVSMFLLIGCEKKIYRYTFVTAPDTTMCDTTHHHHHGDH